MSLIVLKPGTAQQFVRWIEDHYPDVTVEWGESGMVSRGGKVEITSTVRLTISHKRTDTDGMEISELWNKFREEQYPEKRVDQKQI